VENRTAGSAGAHSHVGTISTSRERVEDLLAPALLDRFGTIISDWLNMRPELKKFFLEKIGYDNFNLDRRTNINDRRKLRTYIAKDRRSGVFDRRMKLSTLLENLPKIHSAERRKSQNDRRKLCTYIANDRRSGIADRRSR